MLVGIGAAQNTADLVEYQRTGNGMPMHPHGHPDPATLINLGVYDPADHWTPAQLRYLQSGKKTSTLVRDLQGVSNQIPQWAWLTAGGFFILLGILAFQRSK